MSTHPTLKEFREKIGYLLTEDVYDLEFCDPVNEETKQLKKNKRQLLLNVRLP